jgi:asparagine synthase (glutamine-hydrolysing)
MCGFSAFVFSDQSFCAHISPETLQAQFVRAALKLSHRGSEPLKTEFFPGLYLSHTRLAFQDLSLNTQPLFSADKQYAIVFNGEIYNFKELRSRLIREKQAVFRTSGDTEVLLQGYLYYGESFIEDLEGEYSFVIFRTDGKEIFASRDFFGVKPQFLYLENVDTGLFACAQKEYIFCTPSLHFASEIKGLFPQKSWNKEGLLRQAVGLYEPIRTPFSNVIALPGGAYLKAVKRQGVWEGRLILSSRPVRDLPAQKYDFNKDIDVWKKDFRIHFAEAVGIRTVSDVELGVYLSGGIDSKAVCLELAQHYRTHSPGYALKTFTIGFHDAPYDEYQEAKLFADTFGLETYYKKVSAEELYRAYPLAVYHSENVQPYTNGAAKLCLSNFAAQHVRGVLTGDGADELLCGYPSYGYASWWQFAMGGRTSVGNVLDKLKHNPLSTHWRDSVYVKKYYSSHAQNHGFLVRAMQAMGRIF